MRVLRGVCALLLALCTLCFASCELLPIESTEPTTPPVQTPNTPETTPENLPTPSLSVEFADFNYYEMGKGGWLAGKNMREEETGKPDGYTGSLTKTTSIVIDARAGNVGAETGFIVDIKSVSSAWDGWDEDDYISVWLKVEWTVMTAEVSSFRLHFLNRSYAGAQADGCTNAYKNGFENIMDAMGEWCELQITKADVMNILQKGTGGEITVTDENVKENGLADYMGIYFHGLKEAKLSVYSVEFVEVE